MEFEQVAKEWAAHRFGIAAHVIDRVVFDYTLGSGGGCDTCDYGREDDSLEIIVQRIDDKTLYFQLPLDEFGGIVRGMVEIATNATYGEY